MAEPPELTLTIAQSYGARHRVDLHRNGQHIATRHRWTLRGALRAADTLEHRHGIARHRWVTIA